MTDGSVVVAVDTGGTFTDVVLLRAGAVHVLKVPSTPAHPEQAVLTGVRQALDSLGAAAAELLVHGSTVATNALLERNVARAALVTNRGFEDVLVLGRQTRPQLYALHGERPAPLIPRERRIGVSSRTAADGEQIEPLDEAELAGLADSLHRLGAETAAVVLLHSYADPAHEQAIARALRDGGIPCSVSSELLPEYREYERTATTVVNACITPTMDGYLARLEAGRAAARIRLMGSAGGALTVGHARRAAAETILSGPAGGVAGALHVARRHGIDRIMTFDMGGTSTDVSLCPGEALYTREFAIAGLPVALPVLDIHTVGAGGGSIARLDHGGALRVGPASAGAVPGPICYGRGGTALTVTDANVALGRLVSRPGALQLDAQSVAGPLAALAQSLGCSPAEAAEGVVAVANAAMEGALRVISVERGHDAADFTLVPFGGAAGLHAVALADRLQVTRLLLPPAPGVLSAFGMLVAPVRLDAARSVLLTDPADAELEPVFLELESAALAALSAEHLAPADVALRRTVAARYRGQSHELTVGADGWRAAFDTAHAQRFGYALPDAPAEAVTLRVEATGPTPAVPAPRLPRGTGPARALGSGDVRFEGDVVSAGYFDRDALRPGHLVRGPALVQESTASFWLPPHWSARPLDDGSLIIER